MFPASNLGLLSASISVNRAGTLGLVKDAADQTLLGFDEKARSELAEYITERYRENTHRPHIGSAIKDLGLFFQKSGSNENDNKKCQEKSAELIRLVKEKEETIRDLERKLLASTTEYSPSQQLHINTLRAQISRQKEEIVSMKSQAAELSQKHAEITRKNEDLRSVVASRDQAISQSRDALQSSQEALSRYKESQTQADRGALAAHVKALEEKDKRLSILEGAKARLETEVSNLKASAETKIKDLLSDLESSSSRVSFLDSSIIDLTGKLSSSQAQVQGLSSENDQLKIEAGTSNRTLDQKTREYNQLMSEKENIQLTLETLRKELGSCRASIAAKDKRIDELDKKKPETDALLLERNSTIERLETVIAQRDSEIADSKKMIQDSKDTLDALRSTNSTRVSEVLQEHLKDLEQKDALLKELSGEKKSLESRIEEINSRLENANSLQTSLLKEKELLEGRVEGLVGSMREKSDRVTELDSNIASLKDQLVQRDAKIAQLNTEIESLQTSVAQSIEIKAEMASLQERYEDMSDSHLEYVKDFLKCDEERDNLKTRIDELNNKISECESGAASGDKNLELEIETKKSELQELKRDMDEKIKNHEERLSLKSKQYSDVVGEKGILERNLSKLQKTLDEKENEMNTVSSRVSELERDIGMLTESHKGEVKNLTDRLYKSSQNWSEVRASLYKSETSLSSEKEKKELCETNLAEKDREYNLLVSEKEEIQTKEKELREMNERLLERGEERENSNLELAEYNRKLAADNEALAELIKEKDEELKMTEKFKRATDYILTPNENRVPKPKDLHSIYGTRFLITQPGKTKAVPMRTETSIMGNMETSDLEIFSRRVFRDYKKGPSVVVRVGDRDVTVSLKKNSVFKTWVDVRERNACRFDSPTMGQNAVNAREFLLFLFIVYDEGLYGDDGTLLIPAGRIQSSAFDFSNMFSW